MLKVRLLSEETVGVVAVSRLAVLGTMELLAHDGWEIVCQPVLEGGMWVGLVQRTGRASADIVTRPVAEQAASLGLRRAEGTADVVWSGEM